MSKEIPTSPPIYDLYYSVRSILTPKQNNIYLFVESILLGIIISSFIYIYITPEIYTYFIIISSFLLINITNYMWIEPNKRHREEKTLQVNSKRFIILTIIGLIIPTIIYFLNIISNIVLISTIVTIYSSSLYLRSKKYTGEYVIYVNNNSNIVENWYHGSVAMKQGINHLQSDNLYRSFYWFKKAQNNYNYISENEDRKALREGANELSQSAQLFSVLTFVDELDFKLYHKQAQNCIERANKHFSSRFCDSCGKRKKINDTTTFISEDESNNVYCNACQNKTKYNYKTNKKYQNKKQQRQRHKNNTNKNKRQRKSMTIKKAQNILDMSGDITNSKVKKSYKRKVKETHPDVGGSEEEFKKTEKAKETLLSYLDS